MKTMINKIKISGIAFIALLTFSCTDDLDINLNPLSATVIDPALLYPQIFLGVSQQRTIEGNGMNIQAQHWTSGGSAGVFLNPERYIISANTTNNIWVGEYTTALRNLQQVRILTETNNPDADNIIGQAKVFEAFTYLNLTLVFGDIPFSEAIQVEEFPNPVFDDQLDVLRGIIDRADEGIALLQQPTDIVSTADLIFNGDRLKWIKFANSIKLKALMLLANNDASVASEIATVSNQPLILDNADNAYLPYSETLGNENPLWKTLDQFAGGVNVFWFSGKTLVDMMNTKVDPRRATYLDTIADGSYAGQDQGVASSTGISAISTGLIRRDLEDRYATASENLFYLAEASLRGFTSGNAQNLFEDAVEASLDSYDGQPGEITQPDKNTYLDNLPDLNTLPTPDALRLLHEEKYVALFSRGLEAWTHWRRTKVPEFQQPESASISDIIRRYQVPLSEQSSNPNFPGVEALDTPMAFE
jgi:hypothetical protein